MKNTNGMNVIVLVDNAFISSSTNQETNETKLGTSFQFQTKNDKGKKTILDLKYEGEELANLDSYENKKVSFDDVKLSTFNGAIYLKTLSKPKFV